MSQRLVAAPDRASLNNAVEQSLTVGLLIPAELLGPLDLFDRSLLGLLTFNGEKPMTPGRLAYLLSDHFDNVSVNRVLERLTAIGSHFESNGRGSLLAGDPRGGYLVRV